jgi:hypothetical protein
MYDYPDDLLRAQRDLDQVRADLAARLAALPYSVEPMEAWERPEGYWLATSRAYPDSPGWPQQEQEEVAALRKTERDLTAMIVAHGFWSEIDRPERPDARSRFKHAVAADRDDTDQEEA